MPETKSTPDALATPDLRKPFVAPEVTDLEKLQTLTMLQGVTLVP
jgi:hypothetical protein